MFMELAISPMGSLILLMFLAIASDKCDASLAQNSGSSNRIQCKLFNIVYLAFVLAFVSFWSD